MRKFLDWLLDHGVALALAFIITTTLSILATGMLAVVLLASWWEKIR